MRTTSERATTTPPRIIWECSASFPAISRPSVPLELAHIPRKRPLAKLSRRKVTEFAIHCPLTDDVYHAPSPLLKFSFDQATLLNATRVWTICHFPSSALVIWDSSVLCTSLVSTADDVRVIHRRCVGHTQQLNKLLSTLAAQLSRYATSEGDDVTTVGHMVHTHSHRQ